jgi:hypothetical protein
MRICVAPASAPAPFPTGDDANAIFYGNPPGLNETWCDVVTTRYNVTEWAAKNPDRILPDAAANQYGFSYYGLQDSTYQVEVRLIDTRMAVSDYLSVDAIAVFGGDTPLLEVSPGATSGFYDDRQPGIVYEPALYWTATTSSRQPPFFKTQMQTGKAGSIVRLKVKGNAITIYQSMKADVAAILNAEGRIITPFSPSYTRNMRVCLMVGDGPTPCEPEAVEIGERATASYVQSNLAAAGVPILIYGLGPGEHNLIIENRDTRIMTIDAFRVHPE